MGVQQEQVVQMVLVVLQGSSTASGTSGTAGTTSGANKSGASKTSGSSTASGTSGTAGTNGTSGASRTSGTSSANGTSGTSGTAGTSGLAFNGTSGISGGTFNNQPNYLTYTTGLTTIQSVDFVTIDNATDIMTVDGTLRVTLDVIAYYSSDARLKDNVTPIDNALEKVEKLGGYEFDWNENQNVYEGHDIGVIAQEIESQFPELVTTREDGYKAVKYEKLTAVLIQAIKELKIEVDNLKNRK
jgi:hypothetical protein